MQNEPEYRYVKGKGWVLGDCGRMEETRNGIRIVLEHRQPEPGEYFFRMEPGEVLDDVFRDISWAFVQRYITTPRLLGEPFYEGERREAVIVSVTHG